jgi:hypothetical protein
MKRIEFSVTLMLFVVLQLGVTIGTRANAGSTEQITDMERDTSATADTAAVAPQDSTHIEVSSLLTGHWRAAETADEKKQRLQAIDEVTESLGRFKRGKARGRLKERTSPPPSIAIEVKGSQVAITTGDHQLELELGGSPIEVSGDKETSQVSAKLEEGRLIVTAQGDKGGRTNTYRAEGTGLAMEVTITGEKLDGPLKYATTYARME